MTWTVQFHPEFAREADALSEAVRVELIAAILLVGGDKSGVSSGRFYKGLIKRADARFDQHLEALK